MKKELKKEWILNQANMRWGLTKKKKVGPVAELIRKCEPKTVGQWKDFYFSKVYSKKYLEELGKQLFIKVTDVCKSEIENVTESDCIKFIYNLVINRTFDGYQREIQTIYGQLQDFLKVDIKPAPDEWDRGYNVDYFIKIKNKYIGLQIKPVGYEYIPEIISERERQKLTHAKFTKKFGGKVFYIFSITDNKNKVINNPEVINEIKKEIERLNGD